MFQVGDLVQVVDDGGVWNDAIIERIYETPGSPVYICLVESSAGDYTDYFVSHDIRQIQEEMV